MLSYASTVLIFLEDIVVSLVCKVETVDAPHEDGLEGEA